MSARAWAAFAAISTLWGMPYLFIKVAVDDGVPPIVLAWARLVLGGAILLALAWRAGVLGALRGRGRVLLAYAVIELAIPFPLIGFGEQRVSSSLAAIIIAAAPLIVALLALRFDADERVQGRRLVGLLIGFGGVIALVGIDVAGNPRELVGALAILLAAVGYAAGPMLLSQRLTDVDQRAVMGASLALAAIVLTIPAILTAPSEMPGTDGIASVLVLAVFCTALALTLFGVLITEVGAGRALVITYVAPIVAVGLGVTVLGERVGAGAIAGLLLILAGSWLSTDGRLPPGLVALASRPRRALSSRLWARRQSRSTSDVSAAPASPS
ncbi:MAG TPA: DMT family transporter [Solirubrobacteraceae bacterium]